MSPTPVIPLLPSYYYPPLCTTISFHFLIIHTIRNQDIFKSKIYVVHGTSTPCSAVSRYHVPNRNIIEVEINLEHIQKNETLMWLIPKINNKYLYRSDIIYVLYHPKSSYTLNESTVYPVKEGYWRSQDVLSFLRNLGCQKPLYDKPLIYSSCYLNILILSTSGES